MEAVLSETNSSMGSSGFFASGMSELINKRSLNPMVEPSEDSKAVAKALNWLKQVF